MRKEKKTMIILMRDQLCRYYTKWKKFLLNFFFYFAILNPTFSCNLLDIVIIAHKIYFVGYRRIFRVGHTETWLDQQFFFFTLMHNKNKYDVDSFKNFVEILVNQGLINSKCYKYYIERNCFIRVGLIGFISFFHYLINFCISSAFPF